MVGRTGHEASEAALEIRLDRTLRCVSARADEALPLGIDPARLFGKWFPELLASAEAPAIVEVLRSVVGNGVRALVTASLELDGRSRRVELEVVPVDPGEEDAAAIRIAVVGAVAEVEVAEAPASSGAAPVDGGGQPPPDRFRRLVERMRDGVCEIDEDGRIVWASPSYAALFGRAPDELIGTDPVECVHAQDRRRVGQLLRPGARARRRGPLVYRAQDHEGALLHLEATAREFAAEGGRTHVVVAIRDVTERENARFALERHIELEARVAELSRYFIDLESDQIESGIRSRLASVAILADAQHSRMCSFETGDGEIEIFDWWLEDDPSRYPTPAAESIATYPWSTGLIRQGRVYHVTDVDALPPEARNERVDMLERGVRSILGIPIMSGGRFVGFLGFENFEREINWPEETIMLLRLVGEIFYSALRRRRAIAALRQSQNELLQSQKMEAVGTLAGGIAHDFNNHLAVMLGNARFLRQEVAVSPEVQAAIEDIERAADHCAQLTRSLLTFSRRSPVRIVPVEVTDLIDGVVGLVRPLLPSNVAFETSLMPDLGTCAVDRIQIQQVLVNLLVNARDALLDGGRIRLEARRRRLSDSEAEIEGLDATREHIVLGVTDDGEGMEESTLVRIFEPFFTTKGIGHGTGLGLAMAYGIVQQSGGAIDVESRLGEGSTFRVFLPSARD
jgi:PAS domain S-box-containing protein